MEGQKKQHSIHKTGWPEPKPAFEDIRAETIGEALVEIATAVRRYKSEHSLPLGTELNRLQLAVASAEAGLAQALQEATADLMSITRARPIEIMPGAGSAHGVCQHSKRYPDHYRWIVHMTIYPFYASRCFH